MIVREIKHGSSERFKDFEPDIILERGDGSIRVDFPDGTMVLLHAGYIGGSPKCAVTVYEDPERNPVVSYHRLH
jgi:hypothetical protein